MVDDPHTEALWSQALGLTGQVTSQALVACGLGGTLQLADRPSQVQATIAAASIQACGTIFAALVEAEMVARLRRAQEQNNAG